MAEYEAPKWHGVQYSPSTDKWHVKFKRPGADEELDLGVFEDDVTAALRFDSQAWRLWEDEALFHEKLNFVGPEVKAKWPHLEQVQATYIMELIDLPQEAEVSTDASAGSTSSSEDEEPNRAGNPNNARAPFRVAGSGRQKKRRRSAPARSKAPSTDAPSDSEDCSDHMTGKGGIKRRGAQSAQAQGGKQNMAKRKWKSPESGTKTSGTETRRTWSIEEQQSLFIQTVRLGLVQLFALYPSEPPAERSQAPHSKEELWDAFEALRWPTQDVEERLLAKLEESGVNLQEDSEDFFKLALKVASETPALLRDATGS